MFEYQSKLIGFLITIKGYFARGQTVSRAIS
jgi:hypothetical protein